MTQLAKKRPATVPALASRDLEATVSAAMRKPRSSAGISMGRQSLTLSLMIVVLAALLMTSLALGSVSIPLEQIVSALLTGQSDQPAWTNIILKFRLPKTLTAMLAGMALGVSGLLMQTYFRNPLAEPFVLGVSSGASLGVALVVLSTASAGSAMLAGLGLAGDLLLSAAAGLGAAVTMALVLTVALRVRSSLTLLIMGLMFGYMVAAIVSLLLYFARPERIQAYINWTFGSFSGVTAAQLPILAGIVLPGLLLAGAMVKPLNALLLGEDYARSMGMNLKRTRQGIILATALLVSAVTAFCGPIAFIGIAAPHLCRGILRSSNHRLLLPGTCLVGAIVAIGAAIIAEMPGHNLVLPLNVITALIGAPIVMLVILRQFRGR